MAQIVLNFNDNIAPRVNKALAQHFGYAPKIRDIATGEMIDNPQARANFIKQNLKEWIKEIVVRQEGAEAETAAREAAIAAAKAEIDVD